MGKIRGTHSTPGLYTKITDLQYTAASAGVTTLGLVGETKKGPAFEPIAISSWNNFQDYFGGTSTEKFMDTNMPKYELPYIAKSYLSASDQLYVCRVLGLSGYNAGPAFALTAKGSDDIKHLIALLRAKGSYNTNIPDSSECGASSSFDTLKFACEKVEMKQFNSLDKTLNCDGPLSGQTVTDNVVEKIDVSALTDCKFKLVCNEKDEYVVSLNPGDKEYIYNVLGSTPSEGNALLFVESLYDLELNDLLSSNSTLSLSVETIGESTCNAIAEPVRDFLNILPADLVRKNIGQTFVYDGVFNFEEKFTLKQVDVKSDSESAKITYTVNNDATVGNLVIGRVYTVSAMNIGNAVKYVYTEVGEAYKDTTTGLYVHSVVELTTGANSPYSAIYVLSQDSFYLLKEYNKIEDEKVVGTYKELVPFKSLSNYREQFRHATTPWFVSELKGDDTNIDIKKLFRFHTITDGNTANEQVKITIANVRPDEGTFDVLVRDFFDSDANQVVLESYKGVNLVPGSTKYLGLKVGTLNGDYPLKSKHVIAEIIENEVTETCVPCGFLGYPVHYIDGVQSPVFKYNTEFNEDLRVNKQTFGLSDITGVDVDMLYYKGVDAYTENYEVGYTKGFHLDSNITFIDELIGDDTEIKITVDGVEVDKTHWDTVSRNSVTVENLPPVIGSEAIMTGTIYEDVKVRKFTCYPYGGFDGWDIYRGQRTNGDDYKSTKYKGTISNGHGATFSRIMNGDSLRLSGNAISSDYYAYLAGINQFANPDEYTINLFATPGIDYVNQRALVDDVIEMVHNRQDTFYVVTTPDKPSGAGEGVDEMYSAVEVVDNLDTSAIDTYYASTYYPWIRYYDSANARYISLPVTKDVLRNMADVDNKKYPWYAPAGIERGKVDCTKARIFTKIEETDTAYDGRINPVKTFSADGVKIWGNKTLYTGDTPMNRINTVRLVLYMRKLIADASKVLFFEPNDTTLKQQFDGILRPILTQIQTDRGIVDFRLNISQTPEQMDAHEISAELYIKPTPTLEYIEINFVVTPMGVEWNE